jgi:hypothetical protein
MAKKVKPKSEKQKARALKNATYVLTLPLITTYLDEKYLTDRCTVAKKLTNVMLQAGLNILAMCNLRLENYY